MKLAAASTLGESRKFITLSSVFGRLARKRGGSASSFTTRGRKPVLWNTDSVQEPLATKPLLSP